MQISLRIDSKISFDFVQLREADRKCWLKLRKTFKYKNPKYIENEKWGYSNHDTPEFCKSYKVLKRTGRAYFSRGTKKRLIAILEKFGHTVSISDRRLVLPKAKWPTPKCKPRDEQPKFIQTVLKGDDGIIIAYTSFGKTISAILSAREIGMPVGIMVHSESLQKSWIKELTDPETLNFPRELIGGVGGVFSGKKRRHSLIDICLYHSLSKPEHFKFFAKKWGTFFFDEVQKAPILACQTVVDRIPAKHRIGMTAEVKRKDGKEFLTLDAIGPILKKFVEKDASSKILSKITVLKTGYKDEVYEFDRHKPEMETRASMDGARNKLIIKRAVMKLKLGKVVLIVVSRKYQAARLYWKLNKLGYKGGLLMGGINPNKDIPDIANPEVAEFMRNHKSKEDYDTIKEPLERKELDFVVMTSKGEVGLSFNTPDHLIISTMTTGNLERLNQIIGRIERKYKQWQVEEFGHEKPTPTVDLFWDEKISSHKKHWTAIKDKYNRRVKLYRPKNRRR